jgi:hypothetical protein
VPIVEACALTGRSRATHYRRADPLGPVHGPWLPRGLPPSTITDDERARVLALVNSEPTVTWCSYLLPLQYVPGWLVAHAEDAVVAKDFPRRGCGP